MFKLKVAVIVEENCLPSEGGGYSYYQALIKEIDQHQFPEEIEIVFLLRASSGDLTTFLKPVISEQWDRLDHWTYSLLHKFYKLVHLLMPSGANRTLDRLTERMSSISNWNALKSLRKNQIDLVYYLKPNDYPLDFPMIVTHWDVGHKSMYPFPEVAANGNYQKRENYYAHLLNRALAIICESNAGADELAHFYPINKDKIKVLPLFAGEVVSLSVSDQEQQAILQQFALTSGKFFLYPAQFWAHKNHFNLVTAFHALIRETGDNALRLVLCGADQGNMPYIRRVVDPLGLNSNVIFTGFIENRALYTFYRNANALVMPTFLGPTNLPLIEAAMLNCPVICSDLKGHHELLRDTAIYINPAEPATIASAMHSMLIETNRVTLSARAYKQINESAFHLKKSLKVLEKILLDVRPVRKAWGTLTALMHLGTYANIGIDNF